MNKVWKVSLVTIGAFSAVVLAAVIYGVVTHKEAGLMTACTIEPAGSYNYAGDCFEVRMESAAPFVIDIDLPHDPATDYVGVLKRVVKSINTRLGAELFVVGDLSDDMCSDGGSSICYYPEQPYDVTWIDHNGTARHYMRRVSGVKQLLCDVSTKNTVVDALEALVLEHELLHCAGLDHDSYDMSIMREEQKVGGTRPWISDSDRKLLRKTYNID